MRVTQLWRYPVKSMQGERLEEAVIGKRGIDGDRQWAVIALETGKALTARREPRLLYAYARLASEDAVEVVLPDGTVTSRDDELSTWLGYPVELRRANEEERGTYEIAEDFEHEDSSDWISWNARGSFHDNNRRRCRSPARPASRTGTSAASASTWWSTATARPRSSVATSASATPCSTW
jgi:uncharacterized protein YcbX